MVPFLCWHLPIRIYAEISHAENIQPMKLQAWPEYAKQTYHLIIQYNNAFVHIRICSAMHMTSKNIDLVNNIRCRIQQQIRWINTWDEVLSRINHCPSCHLDEMTKLCVQRDYDSSVCSSDVDLFAKSLQWQPNEENSPHCNSSCKT